MEQAPGGAVSEVMRYIASAWPEATTACILGVFGLARLRMRLKFQRFVVDKAAAQGRPIDATKIIEITTPGARWHQHSLTDEPAQETNLEITGVPPPTPQT